MKICVLELLVDVVLLTAGFKRVAVIGVLSHVVLVVMLGMAKRRGMEK